MKLFDHYAITVGSEDDTFIKVWDYEGKLIHSYNTDSIKHRCCNITNKLLMVGGWVFYLFLKLLDS